MDAVRSGRGRRKSVRHVRGKRGFLETSTVLSPLLGFICSERRSDSSVSQGTPGLGWLVPHQMAQSGGKRLTHLCGSALAKSGEAYMFTGAVPASIRAVEVRLLQKEKASGELRLYVCMWVTSLIACIWVACLMCMHRGGLPDMHAYGRPA